MAMASIINVRFEEVASCLPANYRRLQRNRLFGMFDAHIVGADRLVNVMRRYEPCFKPRSVVLLSAQHAIREVECVDSIAALLATLGHSLESA
ncbi:hypothetical protein ACFONN_14020 [Dyella humi]|uniref:Uncharacterized protein n=1 Tax=Dyella humi TaxID=1770547 RepID=A0ABW8ILM9_9GAMM